VLRIVHPSRLLPIKTNYQFYQEDKLEYAAELEVEYEGNANICSLCKYNTVKTSRTYAWLQIHAEPKTSDPR
jgi:hypothetical protein